MFYVKVVMFVLAVGLLYTTVCVLKKLLLFPLSAILFRIG